ncbi:LysE family translocator [Aidingimonas halophila]|uniref:Threonine/homoserine/homoserine lactone efflux protein n=1 Tax=Aidingimonas halophila TaxID=574349 RepID=A0A1H3F2D3_9GAMM|nr:LysE family translocator [Aidingimonas halophila]GHC32228.1 threonine transporter RhtB [Aidingimonas halophila]SDX85132.1 Threonine/homoserine/homoserine lactone efflux protein [Aidingimonas halophila]
MIDAQFLSFLAAITLLTLSPGVDTLLVIRNASRGGLRDGILTSVAICSGLFVHASVSALGISMLLLQSAWAFNVLKVAGAAYLIWLGLQSLNQARRGRELPMGDVQTERQRVSMWTPLREGLLSNVLNPKTVMFYMAFLPQFIAPGEPALLKSLWLASVHFVIANIWQIAIAAMVGSAARWLAKRWVSRGLDGVTGAVLVAFGLKLALHQRPA